jgi:uncharacterized membrane protein YidH (DUF202 family)
VNDPGGARERTALAWTRSALNMAASGTLIARAGFAAHLSGLGIASALATATLAYLTWRHGRAIYHARGRAGAFPHHQPGALSLLTTATLLTAAVAIVVTIAT